MADAISILGLACACVSIVASFGLLSWLCAVQPVHKKKLMCRQLWHLTTADFVFGVFTAVSFLIRIMTQHKTLHADSANSTALDSTCVAVSFMYKVGFDTSILMESHLALSFAAAIYRWPKTLYCLRFALWFIWPLSIIVALAETWLVDVFWDASSGCSQSRDFTLVSLQILCVSVSVTCYLSSLGKTCLARRASPNAVQLKVWRRVHAYLLAWLICDLPDFITILIGMDSDAFALLALSLFNLNPLANVLVYAYQSRYMRRVEANRTRTAVAERTAPLNAGGSFQIAFGADSVHEFATSTPATESERHSDASLFDVEDEMFSVLEIDQSFVGSDGSADVASPSSPSTGQVRTNGSTSPQKKDTV